MNDPAQNPYVASGSTPGGSFPAGQAPGTINSCARTGTILSLALIGGVVMITGVMAFMTLSDPPKDQPLIRFDGDALLFLAVGYIVFFGSVAAAFVLRKIMRGQAIARFKASSDPMPRPLEGDSPLPQSARQLLGAVSAYTLVGQALMEGPAVINAIFLMIESNFAHVIPIVLAVIGIAIQFPTAGKIKALMEDADM